MIKNESNLENLINFESFIGPWVLPNEEIPIHITWNKDFDFDQILVEFPSDLSYVELINAVYSEISNTNIIIMKNNIKHLGHGTHPNFIGIIFIYREINYEGLKRFYDIDFKFLNKIGEIVEEIKLTAKIFRPKLRNITEIPPTKLIDNKNDYSVEINLIYEGFGFVAIKLEPEINKSKIPFDKSIFENVIENFEKKYIPYLENVNSTDDKNDSTLEIDVEKYDIFMQLLKKFNEDKTTREKDIGKLLKEKRIQDLLITDFYNELITELRLRYKYENVVVKNSNISIPREKFRDIIHNSKLRIYYKDLNDNSYDPVEIDLDLQDHRSNIEKPMINFKIQIKKITDNTFRDIEKVRRNKIE